MVKEKHQYSSAQINKFLEKRYSSDVSKARREWIYCSEVNNSTGTHIRRRLDGWAINCWPSNHFRSLGFEIKISRQDFFKEIQEPEKRKAFYDICSEFWYVTPWGLIDPEEVPEECGLMWVNSSEKLVRKKIATQRTIKQFSPGFLASILRNLDTSLRCRNQKLEQEHNEWQAQFDGRTVEYNEFADLTEKAGKLRNVYSLKNQLRKSIKKDLYDKEDLVAHVIMPAVNELLRSTGFYHPTDSWEESMEKLKQLASLSFTASEASTLRDARVALERVLGAIEKDVIEQ